MLRICAAVVRPATKSSVRCSSIIGVSRRASISEQRADRWIAFQFSIPKSQRKYSSSAASAAVVSVPNIHQSNGGNHRSYSQSKKSSNASTTTETNIMRLYRHAPVALLVTTAVVFSLQPVPLCRAEKFRFFSSKKDDDMDEKKAKEKAATASPVKKKKMTRDSKCPFYGCPLKPVDVHYNTDDFKKALEELRNDKRVIVSASTAAQKLASSSTHQHATLTLIGYKGGDLKGQINQDRALIVAPYTIHPLPPQKKEQDDTTNAKEQPNVSPMVTSFLNTNRILLGVFDGHAPYGEMVSEYTASELPNLLATKLVTKALATTFRDNFSERDEIEITKTALVETFVELDRTAPADPSGGCTATVILQQGTKVYIANAGDSRSFIVAYRPSTRNVTVTYISREDKPSLPDERARVEAAGGQVYIPAHGTSRVVYHDSTTGAPTGLAMSRSIGDWEAGKMGVIPDPIVDVIDTNAVIANILLEDVGDETDSDSYQVNPVGSIVDVIEYSKVSRGQHTVGGADDDVYLFAVSATDGMMDYLAATEIARILAHSLFDEAGAHPVTAVEHLIFAAANAWQDAKQGRYRDDIAIAVAALRRPPNHQDHHNNTQAGDNVSDGTSTLPQ